MAYGKSSRTFALGISTLVGALTSVSCGGAQGDDDDAATGGSSSGGTSGSATGGSATGGSSGSSTGGTGGADECPSTITPQTCSGSPPNMHMPADALLINWDTYVASSGNWGNMQVGDLTGGTSKYSGKDVPPITATLASGSLRLTATLPPYTPNVADDAENYAGLVFWFGPCVDASAFGGLTFALSGSMPGAALKLQVQTSENYPADPANTKGECIYESCAERWAECKGPDTMVVFPQAGEPATYAWGDFANGSPNAAVNAEGLVGLQFQLECQSQEAPCDIDITLGDISLTPL
jgi:hypothetical protein